MKNLKTLFLFVAVASAESATLSHSDCVGGNADSSCVGTIARAPTPSPPAHDILYQGPIAGAATVGASYFGFDFASYNGGVPSPLPRDMFVNRSDSAISLDFTFDLPPGPCGSGCLPGVEFKLDAKWGSFFPNMIVADHLAMTSMQIAPQQAYGWVIALWGASNPRLTVRNLSAGAPPSLTDTGLAPTESALPIPGSYFECTCGDGVKKTCYSGTRYSNGLMGGWYRDRYFAWDAVTC